MCSIGLIHPSSTSCTCPFALVALLVVQHLAQHRQLIFLLLSVYLTVFCLCRNTAKLVSLARLSCRRCAQEVPVPLETHSARDTKLNTPCAADHGAGSHLLARYACHAASNALWICLACWAGIGAAVNGGTKKPAKWTRHVQDSIPGSLRGVDFWPLQTAAAAAASGTKHTTREFAEVKHDPPEL